MPMGQAFREKNGLRISLKIHKKSAIYQRINLTRETALPAAKPRPEDEDRGD